MKTLLAIAYTFFSAIAFANTQAVFRDLGSTVSITGEDARDLFNSISLPPDANQKKYVVFFDDNEAEIFKLSCSIQACELDIFKNNFGSINPQRRYFYINFSKAPLLYDASNVFIQNHQGAGGVIFESNNRRLGIWKTYTSQGQLGAFTIRYTESLTKTTQATKKEGQ